MEVEIALCTLAFDNTKIMELLKSRGTKLTKKDYDKLEQDE